MNIEKKFDELLASSNENEVFELKEANENYDFNKLGKYFSALSNEANLKAKESAWLIFGIRDKDKRLVNTNFRKFGSELQKLKSEIANHTNERITFIEIHELLRDGQRVIIFEIPPAPQGIPVSWKGHFYGRDNEEIHPLNIEELERIRKQSLRDDWSVTICDNATLDDLSESAIEKAKFFYIKKHLDKKEEIESWDNYTFLNKAKITINGKITRTAIILLGKPESEHYLSPGIARISWVLKDKENVKDYQHFSCPFILNIDNLYSKIRNLKYRYITGNTLFPEEVDRYDPITIREALNNCIAHQDYSLGGKINVVENEDDSLIFSNLGSFIPKTIDNVIASNSPSEYYRNRFLVDAMVSLDMIDTVGSGIRKMFFSQKKKLFPLPEYDLTDGAVKVTIYGKILDINYATKLVQVPNLDLPTIILLDKVQKGKKLSNHEINFLRRNNLIEGRQPNIFISSNIAKVTEEKSEYMKRRGIDDEYCQKMILDYLHKFGKAKRKDLENMLLEKLSNILTYDQKKDKVKNILQKLKMEGSIFYKDSFWFLSNI